MDLHQWKCLAVIIVAIIVSICIRCYPTDFTTPCRDVAEAINRLYRFIYAKTSLEARCKVYAVFLSIARVKGANNQLAVVQTLELEELDLDSIYSNISDADSASRYINTIDIYRTSHLEPAFLDVIECLRLIDEPEAKAYLQDPELMMIVNLYKRAIGPPATEIDLDSLDLKSFHPAFQTALRNLFGGHFDAKRPSTRIDDFGRPGVQRPRRAGDVVKSTDERLWLTKSPQLRYRERNLMRIRERDRLSQKRQRYNRRLQQRAIERQRSQKLTEEITRRRLNRSPQSSTEPSDSEKCRIKRERERLLRKKQ